MERLTYICTTEDDGAEVLTLLRREFQISTNLLRQLKVTENGIMLDDVRVTVRHTVVLLVTIEKGCARCGT